MFDPALPEIEQPFAQAEHPVECPEQTGMAGDPAHQPGVLIVYLALQHPAAPGTVLGGRDTLPLHRQGLVQGEEKKIPGQTEPPCDKCAKTDRQRLTGAVFEHMTEQYESQVAVPALTAGG